MVLATGSLGDTESNSQTIYSSLVVNGVAQDGFQFEPKDYNDNMTFVFPYVANFSTSQQNISINSYAETNDGTWNRIRDLRIVAIPMDEYWDLQYAESLAQSDNTGSTRLNKTTLTFTPEYAGNYTFIATAQIYTAITGRSGDVYFNFNGSDVCEMHKEQKELGIGTDGDWHSLMCMYQVNLDESEYSAVIQWAEGDIATTSIRNAKIIAFSTENNEPDDSCGYSGSGIWSFFVDIYCYIIGDTTGDGSNIVISKTNTTEFNNVNISGFQNLTISNSSSMILNNGTSMVIG
jgi:hypothetical protein